MSAGERNAGVAVVAGSARAQWGVVALAAVGFPLLALCATLWPALHAKWVDSYAYSHGYLVLGLVVWLVAREARRAPIEFSGPSHAGLCALALVVAVALFGRAADIQLFQQFAVPASVIAALWTIAGWRTATRFVVPVGYLIFALPVWDSINEPLRATTVLVVGALTRAVSIPVFIDGNFIHIPSGTFEVAGGCSGLHYLIVGAALATYYALLQYRLWSHRAALVAFAVILALVANWARVFIVIAAGHLTDMRHYLVTVDHYYFGWVLFVLFLAPLFVLARNGDRSSELVGSVPAAASARGVQSITMSATIVAASLLLGCGAWLSVRAAAKPDGPFESTVIDLPKSIADWEYESAWDDVTLPRFESAPAQGRARYDRRNERVSVYLAHYPVQTQGVELVYYANKPAGRDGEILRRSTREVRVADGEAIPFTELEVRDPATAHRLVWLTYRVAGRRTSRESLAKFFQVVGAFWRQWDAQVLVISADCAADCESARTSLGRFVRDGSSALLSARNH